MIFSTWRNKKFQYMSWQTTALLSECLFACKYHNVVDSNNFQIRYNLVWCIFIRDIVVLPLSVIEILRLPMRSPRKQGFC